MPGKVECVTLGLTTIESLPEIQISHLIACKNYEEKITTIHTCKIYNDVFNKERESSQQKVHENKRILLVDDEYDVILVTKSVLGKNGFKVDSFTDASQAAFAVYNVKWSQTRDVFLFDFFFHL
jgi:PleD family two-component response regulator